MATGRSVRPCSVSHPTPDKETHTQRGSRGGQSTDEGSGAGGPSALDQVLQKDSVWGYEDQVGFGVRHGCAW